MRVKNPSLKQFSWFHGKKQAAGIDYFLINDELATSVSMVKYKPGILSDHSQMMLQICTDLPKREKGLWKMNTLHLKNQDYKEGMTETIELC